MGDYYRQREDNTRRCLCGISVATALTEDNEKMITPLCRLPMSAISVQWCR